MGEAIVNSHMDDSLKHFHRLVGELEEMAKSAAGAAGEGGSELARQLRDSLAAARARLRDAEQSLEREVGRGAQAADGFVRENVWASIGIAAAVAFVLGALFARRD